MEKNAIVAIVLSLLVLLVWNQVFIAPQQKKLQEERARQAELAQQEGQTDDGAAPVQVGQGQETTAVESILPSTETPQQQLDESAEEIIVKNSLMQLTFTAQGGRVKSWQLLQHKGTDGNPVELVSQDALKNGQLPLQVYTGDNELDAELNFGRYRSTSSFMELQTGDDPLTFSLTYESSAAGAFTKEFTVFPDSYKVDTRFIFESPNDAGKALSVVWGPGLGSDLEDTMRFQAGVVSKTSEPKPIRDDAKKIDGLMTHRGVEWAVLDQKYFTVALFPYDLNNTLSINRMTLQPQDEKEKISPIREVLFGVSQPLDEGIGQLSIYAGPKQRAALAQAYAGFENLIDYGFFGFIAQPLALFMDFLYQYLNNYGLVIICLTILIKIVFYPLTHKSFSSMKRMQDLQPHMKKLQEQYKNDKEALNREMMKLYKEKGVNPMGGCFPMLLQIPVFFALYQTLSQSIELRGASFLWVTDLSSTETLFFKPLVLMMGASMFFQQSMTPTTTDNKQAQMFKFMPILFTAMFWSFPSGLVLYWFMNNILTIGQQYLINKSGDKKSAKQAETTNEETPSKSRKRRKKGK